MDLTHDAHQGPVRLRFAVLAHLEEHLVGRDLGYFKHITSTADAKETRRAATWMRLYNKADLACL